MSNFQKRYFYNFGSNSNNQYTVELWQDIPNTITASGITGDLTPFKVTYPTTTNKFDAVRGSGCDLNIVSKTSMQFIDLYQNNMMNCQIKLFNSGSSLIWNGYLTSEIYSEPFAEYDNYTVSLTGNDGLALLDRLDFVTTIPSGTGFTNYTGFTNNWTIITNILGKLNLSWNAIYVGLSTTSAEFSIDSNNSILTTTYSNCENYYDEDGKPMSCREVLKTILTPFSAYIQIVNSNVFITDINFIANGSTTFLKYNGSTFAYISNSTISTTLGDLSTIKFANNSQTFNIIAPVNKQKVIFSPYINSTYLEYSTKDDKFSGSTRFDFGVAPYDWYEMASSYSNLWTKITPTTLSKGISRFSELTGLSNNIGTTDKYFTIGSGATSMTEQFIFSGTLPKILIDSTKTYYIKLETQCYVATTDNMDTTTTTSVTANSCFINSKFIIGNKQYSWSPDVASTDGWVTPSGSISMILYFENLTYPSTRNKINDIWTSNVGGKYWGNWDTPMYIPLDTSITGDNVYFSIMDYDVTDGRMSPTGTVKSQIKNVRIKDLKITIVDENKNDISNVNIEYWSYINKSIKDDGTDVTCKLGTNINYVPTAKGSLFGYNSNLYYTQLFTRNGKTNILENLLSGSITSNYTNTTTEIICKINNIPSIFGSLTYNNYFNNTFGIQGATIDYSDETIDLTLQEIYPDTLDLKNNY